MMIPAEIPATAWPFIGGGVLVLWTVREFLGHLKSRGATDPADEFRGLFRRLNTLVESTASITRDVDVLVEMHSAKDEDGVYVWHLRRDLVRTIQALEDSQGEVVELIREHGAQLATQSARLEELCRRTPVPPGGN